MQRAREVIENLIRNNFYYSTEPNPAEQKTILHECLEERTLRKDAKRFYATHIRVFLKWYNSNPLKCTREDALNFQKYLKQKGNSATTINHYRNTVLSDKSKIYPAKARLTLENIEINTAT
jgi:hypothetical protein